MLSSLCISINFFTVFLSTNLYFNIISIVSKLASFILVFFNVILFEIVYISTTALVNGLVTFDNTGVLNNIVLLIVLSLKLSISLHGTTNATNTARTAAETAAAAQQTAERAIEIASGSGIDQADRAAIRCYYKSIWS